MKLFRSSPLPQNFLVLVVATLLGSGFAEANSAPVVPFKATFTITESIQITGAPCVIVGNITGTGVATHLGKSKIVSQDCINPTNPDFTDFIFVSNSKPPVTLTGANGDQVLLTYSGTFSMEGTVDAPIGVISGGYQIVGGTGRFSNATGAGSVVGVEDLSTPNLGKGQVTLNGTIAY